MAGEPEPLHNETAADRQARIKQAAERTKQAIRAQAFGEGRRAERNEIAAERKAEAATHTGQIDGIKAAHIDELNRSGKIVAKAAHRDGVLHGILLGGAMIAATIAATWFIVTQVVMLNTATQRVNYPNPPELTVPESNQSYPRINPREPGDAN